MGIGYQCPRSVGLHESLWVSVTMHIVMVSDMDYLIFAFLSLSQSLAHSLQLLAGMNHSTGGQHSTMVDPQRRQKNFTDPRRNRHSSGWWPL